MTTTKTTIQTPAGDIREGSIIEYTAFGGERRQVEVECVDQDIKNGRAGFDGFVAGGRDRDDGVWGYADQVDRVIKF